jgi:flagellar basal body-associated protein FliL
MTENKLKNTVSKILNILLYVFIGFMMVFLILVISFRNSKEDATTVFGYQMRTVISPSMESCELTDVSNYEIKSLPLNTMIFVEVLPTDEKALEEWYRDLEIGDVVTFKYVYVRQEVITHRLVGKEDNGKGGYNLYFEGDNKNSEEGVLTQVIDTSNEFSPNFVIGKVVGHSYLLGIIVTFLKSTIGLVLIIVLIVVILVLEIFRLVKLLTAGKREAEKKKQEEQLKELEELREKLAILEQQNISNEG